MYKIGFISLGCPKNLCDTEVMLHKLVSAGYEITPEETDADVIVINTCAFIEEAKREAIDNILDCAWLKKNHTLKAVVVSGCLAERYRDELFSRMPEIDCAIGVGSLDDIVAAVESAIRGERFSSYRDKADSPLGGDRIVTTEGTAYLKISEGCDNRCAYCAIPNIRGPLRSRPMEDIIDEAKELCELGIKELVIIAQDTTGYGADLYGSLMLPELLLRIIGETDIPWIRLLYCYPDKITDELCRVIAENDRIVRYVDLPIQHISDSVLARMNRHGDSSVIRDAIRRLRTIDKMVLRSTVIVGFPGETDEDFEKLCSFINEAKFERLGAFAYSREEDTPAYSMKNQIDEQLKRDRCDILMKAQLEVSEAYNRSRIGKVYDVFCEGYDAAAGCYFGRSYAEAAQIDGKIFFEAPKDKYQTGDFVRIKITEALDYDLKGTVSDI